MAGLSLREKVRRLGIWRGLKVELLVLCINHHQLRWFRQQARIPPRCLPKENILSTWDETQRQIQGTLERLYIRAGLETPWDPPKGVGGRKVVCGLSF